MKMQFILILAALFCNEAFCGEVTDKNFNGKWCGKWDNTYSLCIQLNDINNNPIAEYSWQERVDGKFHKTKKRITRFNQYTLKLENIWFTIDKKNPEQAQATGLFTSQTRKARLTKSSD